jgi:diaminohydroxyphosphoribosylaminopyrimidine deaminase/5-amino-6-(5-phosphoribosylamino)uracil reductase
VNSPVDPAFMRRALELAQRGWGRVHPNPLVGAVVVRDGRVVGEGWHAEFGGAHAEVVALAEAGELARGADLYVSLEPCAHHGKTPPCTQAIIAAGIGRVVQAVSDPSPDARGGASLLAASGIAVVTDVLAAAARTLNAAFFHVHEHNTPFVALKLALSLDGCIARAPGQRTQLTGPEADAETHRLRAAFDALMVGSGTAAIDDPYLTVRGDVQPRVPPLRVVVDTDARTRADSNLARTADRVPFWVLFSRYTNADNLEALRLAGARTIAVLPGPDGVALDSALESLWDAGVRSILCEGGARLAASLLAEDRVQRAYLFYAPVFLGAAGVRAFPFSAALDTRAWQLTESRAFGTDALLVWDRVRDLAA